MDACVSLLIYIKRFSKALYSNLFKSNFGRNFGRFLQRARVAERWTGAVFTVYCVQPTESVRGPQ